MIVNGGGLMRNLKINKLNYKIGQKVWIKPLNEIPSIFRRESISPDYYNTLAIITQISEDRYGYKINIDGGQFYWYEEEMTDIKKLRSEKLNKINNV